MVTKFKELNKKEVLKQVIELLNSKNILYDIDDCNLNIIKGRYSIGLQFEFWDETNLFSGVQIWIYDTVNSNDYNNSIDLEYFDNDNFDIKIFEETFTTYVEKSSNLNIKLGIIRDKITEIYDFAKINEIENNLVDELFCSISQKYE